MKIVTHNFWYIVGLLFFVELLSFLSFIQPTLNTIFFVLLCLLLLLISVWRLDVGLLMVFGELFIGSKGYLFSLTLDGFSLSLRIAFFLIIMSVWLLNCIKQRHTYLLQREKTRFLYFFLFISLVFSVVRGFWFHNNDYAIFFDANAFVFFLYIFPLLDTYRASDRIRQLLELLAASTIAVGVKTLVSLFLFASRGDWIVLTYYRWIRDTGVGEITPVAGNFFRIFFQSQIYSLIAFFVFLPLFLLTRYTMNAIEKKIYFIVLVVESLTILLSLSRSYWVGAFVAMVGLLFALKWHENFSWRRISLIVLSMMTLLAFEVFAVYALIRSPLGSVLGKRITDVSEPAASSRMNQLEPLRHSILEHPWLGSGFGRTVTYITNDPRARAYDSTGRLTTYSFEWGYLDIMLKMGIVGFGVYLLLLSFLATQAHELYIIAQEPVVRAVVLGLTLALFALMVTNIFSPYLNHPLGIGYIVIITTLFSFFREGNRV